MIDLLERRLLPGIGLSRGPQPRGQLAQPGLQSLVGPLEVGAPLALGRQLLLETALLLLFGLGGGVELDGPPGYPRGRGGARGSRLLLQGPDSKSCSTLKCIN